MCGQTSADFGSPEPKSGIHRSARPVLDANRWLSQRDEADLREFFRNGGSNATTRSTTAACMAVIEQRRAIAKPCELCGGDVASGRPGTGFVDSRTGRFPDSKAKTHDLLELLDLKLGADGRVTDASAELPEPEFGDQLCPDCEGRCWLVGAAKPAPKKRPLLPPPPASPFRVSRGALDGLPNAWPLLAQEAPQGYVLSEQMLSNLALLGKISTRIKAVVELTGGEVAVEALGCFFSPDGGTIAALWHLVPAGKTMLRSNPQKLHHSQLFQNLRDEQRTKRNANRAEQFKAADTQSLELFEGACQLWNLAAPAYKQVVAHDDEVQEILSFGIDPESLP